ncbi:hypothetical protein E2320_020278, partial [Naja naja]
PTPLHCSRQGLLAAKLAKQLHQAEEATVFLKQYPPSTTSFYQESITEQTMISRLLWPLVLLDLHAFLVENTNEEKRNGVRKQKSKPSESAKNFNHEQQKKFVLETVDRMKGLQLSSGRTLSWRTALLQYSSTVLIEQAFRDWKGPRLSRNSRSVKVAVLLTDGADHPRNPDIFSATADAKHQGIAFFTVGMTRVAEEVANAAKLRLLASVPASRFVFNLQEKDVVERILKEMKDLAEEGCPQPPVCNCEKGDKGLPGP